MMKPGFTVGETARICSIPADTLRYYDKIGLIHPSNVGENGYRYYSYEDFLFLSTIKYLKKLGMPLADMKQLLDNRCKEATRENFFAQLEQIDRQIEELQGIRSQLLRNIHYFDFTDTLDLDHQTPELKEFPDRMAIFSSGDTFKTLPDPRSYDVLLSDVMEELDQENYWNMGPTFSVKSREDVLSGELQRPKAAGNMLVDKSRSDKARKIPGGLYACLYRRGGLDQMKRGYDRLLRYIKENGYEIIGDIYEIFLVDTIDTKIDEELVIHIQIPVQRENG